MKRLYIYLIIAGIIVTGLIVFLAIRRKKIRKAFQDGKSWVMFGFRKVVQGQNYDSLPDYEKTKVLHFMDNHSEFADNLKLDILRALNFAHISANKDLSGFASVNADGLIESFTDINFSKFTGVDSPEFKPSFEAIANEYGVNFARSEEHGGYNEGLIRRVCNWNKPEKIELVY